MQCYTVKPTAYVDTGEWEFQDPYARSSVTIFENRDPIATGLLDADGNELRRERGPNPVGFITFKE